MADVFISYERGSEASAQQVAGQLKTAGFEVWLDADLPTHRAYTDVIREQLQAAKAVLVLWTGEAAQSDWVRAEAELAREQRKLVQASLDGSLPPLPFNQIHSGDLSHWRGAPRDADWLKVVKSIAELVGRSPKLLQGDGPAAPSPPSGASDQVRLSNLPRQAGPLIGREPEMADLSGLLAGDDLVTITGTGGVGKTRIAIEIGRAQLAAHPDGVWLAELAPVTDAREVPFAVARALGIELPPNEDSVTALVDRLRLRRCLIILDNCEHVIDAAAEVAEAVLDATDGVKLLASSQEPLGIGRERVFRLRSLRDADGVALFVERAAAADQNFTASEGQSDAMAAICNRLDGIPLAIEMAAARAPALGCDGVLQRLDDRFRLLTGGRRTALPRQRTLHATLDWSHGLLSPQDAAVFRRLGVFSGGFSLDAASHVGADDVIDAMGAVEAVASLVAKSLVVVDGEEGRTRYRLLETMRAYALEKLDAAGETPAALRRHAQFFAKFTEQSRRDFYGPVSDKAFADRYFADIDNIYRALDWAFGAAGELAIGVELAATAWPIALFLTRVWEHAEWLDRAYERLHAGRPAPQARANLLDARAEALGMIDPARAVAAADEALEAGEALADPLIVANALTSKALALVGLGRANEAEPVTQALLALAPQLPPSRRSASAPLCEAMRLLELGNRDAARELFERAEVDLRAIGADGAANHVMVSGLGAILKRDDPAAAIDRFRELQNSIRPWHMLSSIDTHNAAGSLAMLLLKRAAPGDLEEAAALCVIMAKALGPANTIVGLTPFVVLAAKLGRAREGARLAGFDKGLRAVERPWRAGDPDEGEDRVAQLKSALPEVWLKHAGVVDDEAYSLEVLKAALPEAELAALIAEGERMTPQEGFRLVTGLV